jgi:antitoxin (DNA-binding transcriptional repressor) of toxin-antitoxin stability system
MAAIHVSEAEAAVDFARLLACVRAGDEIIIESGSKPIAVIRPAADLRGRFLSESLDLAEAHAAESGVEAVMDADFAADLKEIIRNRKPRDLSAWE